MKKELTMKEIDLSSYARKSAYDFFSKVADPYISFTVQQDISLLYKKIKERKLPFFLSLQFVLLRAMERCPNLMSRKLEGKLYTISHLCASFTFALKDGTFAFCSAYPYLPFETYLSEVLKAEQEAEDNPELADDEKEVPYMVFVSSVPWFSYTGHEMEKPLPPDSNPRLTWGKFFFKDEKVFLPLTIQVNHALVDGRDLGDFFSLIEEEAEKF
ncbi:MAG: CatA-like O-acetyltransferase [Bacilli bacterium]|jgi:chloramphenicol O-acetyltransferase type A|nr:CatA-like O-acetyltransferase [Bacilli bacterium]